MESSDLSCVPIYRLKPGNRETHDTSAEYTTPNIQPMILAAVMLVVGVPLEFFVFRVVWAAERPEHRVRCDTINPQTSTPIRIQAPGRISPARIEFQEFENCWRLVGRPGFLMVPGLCAPETRISVRLKSFGSRFTTNSCATSQAVTGRSCVPGSIRATVP